jgi:hypothetical protein
MVHAADAPASETWTPILPVPPDAPKIDDAAFTKLAPTGFKPTRAWPYRDPDGQLLGYIFRCEPCSVDDEQARKQIRPLTFCSNKSGGRAWRVRGFVPPRPMYGLDRLAKHRNAVVIITEGEKACDALTDGPYAHAFEWAPVRIVNVSWPGGCHAIAKADGTPLVDLSPLAGRDVITWEDADKPGADAMDILIARLLAVGAKSIRRYKPPINAPEGWDAADPPPDGFDVDGIVENVLAAPVVTAQPITPNRLFEVLSYADMVKLPQARWLVENVLPANAVTVIFGKSNSFKSFLAIDLACSVATGRPWHGRSVAKGKVLYIATEGAAAVARKRIPAWMAYHQIPVAERDNIYLMRDVPVLNDADDVRRLAETIKTKIGSIILIVVDVLVGTLRGSERDDQAVGEWVRGVQQLIEELGCAQLHVTHSPDADEDRMRGHTHLRGSMDTRIIVTGNKDSKTATLTIERHKDFESGGSWGFHMEVTNIDEFENETSLVPVLDEGAKAVRTHAAQAMGKHQKTALAALRRAVEECGQKISSDNLPAGVPKVPEDDWRRYFNAMTAAKGDSRKHGFSRAVPALIEKGLVCKFSDWFWLAPTGERAAR